MIFMVDLLVWRLPGFFMVAGLVRLFVVKACSYHEALEGNSETASDTETELSISS